MKWFIKKIRRLLRWLRRLFKPKRRLHPLIPSSQNHIQQTVHGDRNQIIAHMSAATAINNLIQHFHLSPQDILTLESFWENWSQDTNPPLSPSLVVGGRKQERDRIISWLQGSPSPLSLQAESPEEAIAFLAAVVHSLEDEERINVLPRAIVVNSAMAWRSLILSSDAPLILIPRFPEVQGIGQATKNEHHVFIPLGRTSSDKEHHLPRIRRDAAEKALRAMGFSRDSANKFATLARRSLSALRRKLAITPNIQQPAWAKPQEAQVLLAPLLVSAWKDSCEGDREALAQLSMMPYERLKEHLVRWANEPDPPIRKVGDIWMIAAQEDAWRLLAKYLTNDYLQRFENVAIDILSELDPVFELPRKKRHTASIYGNFFTRSRYIRVGIAETLALMVTLSSEVSFSDNITGDDVAQKSISLLMKKVENNADLWASIAYQLPLLAEAAPDVFLNAVNTGLSGENPILVNLFQDQTSGTVLISSPHTGLLWALETLAWHPNHLSQAALNLAQLTRLDPGGRFANRPAASLRDIFVCCYPNTTAPLNSRLQVIDTIRRQEPEVAWHLLLNLLPKPHSAVSPNHGTKWRDWVPDHRTQITIQEYLKATKAILHKLLSDAGTDVARWCSLITEIASMTDEQQESLLIHLERLEPQEFSSKERSHICDCLRRETTRHQDFADAKWAMPTEQVRRLEQIYTHFKPDNLVDRHQWLFKDNVELPGIRHNSWEEQEKKLEDCRTEVLQEILKVQGWDGVLKLSEQLVNPALVGQTLAGAELLPIDVDSFLEDNFKVPEAWRSQMAQRFVMVNAYNRGEQWIEARINANLERWTSEQYGEFLLCLPFDISLLNRLDAANNEVQQYFWSRTQKASFLNVNQADRVLTRLIKFQRFHFATKTLQRSVEKIHGIISPERIAQVLYLSIQAPPEPDFDISIFSYCSSKLLDYLEKTKISRERLVHLEWLYLQINKHYRSPKLLYEELSTNPTFFVEVLQCIFPSENEPLSEEQSAKAKTFAKLAWDLLESWNQMPGVQEDDSVDAEFLREWVIGARKLAAECGRTEIADIYIGNSLASSPTDETDGVWPHRAVRDLIEELANSAIQIRLCTQVCNNRGATIRRLTDGGQQERIFVEQYQGYAKQIRDQWPRTAAVLRDLAQMYRRNAAGQDQLAELTEDSW